MANNNDFLVEDDGISLTEIFSWIKSKFKVLLAVFISTTLIIFLTFYFLVAPSSKTYSISFSYDKAISLNEGKYLDGTFFDFRDILKTSNLQKVKDYKQEYANINVEELAKDETLKISQNKLFETDKNGKNSLIGINYELVVPAKYFDNKELAINYLKDLVNTPIVYNYEYLSKLNMFNFNLYDNSKTFTDDLLIINSMINSIDKGYNDLITFFGNPYIKDDSNLIEFNNTLLTTIYDDFKYNVSKSNLKALELEHNTYSYVKDFKNNKYRVLNQINVINYELKTKQSLLNSLNSQLDKLIKESNGNDFGQSITTLVDKITALEVSVHDLTIERTKCENILKSYESDPEYIANPSNKDYIKDTEVFAKSLNNVYELVKNEALKYNYIYQSLYSKNCNILYLNNSIVSVDAMSTVVTGIVSVFLGFGLGVVVAGVCGYQSSKKKSKLLANKE